MVFAVALGGCAHSSRVVDGMVLRYTLFPTPTSVDFNPSTPVSIDNPKTTICCGSRSAQSQDQTSHSFDDPKERPECLLNIPFLAFEEKNKERSSHYFEMGKTPTHAYCGRSSINRHAPLHHNDDEKSTKDNRRKATKIVRRLLSPAVSRHPITLPIHPVLPTSTILHSEAPDTKQKV